MRVTGGRAALSSGVLREIRREVEKLAIRFNCSKSLVVASILGEALGIKEQEKYYVDPK
jgi:hypothetical protein